MNEAWAVNNFARQIASYDASRAIAGVSLDVRAGFGTGALATYSQAGSAARYIGKGALAFDTASNVVNVGRGVNDAYNNGLGFGNSVQIIGSGLGLGGNVATGGRALQEIASDATRLRVQPAGLYGGVPVPKISLAPKSVHSYEVGTYNDLARRSVGDNLSIHHVGQGHPMGQLVAGYDYSVGPAIAVPRQLHAQIPTIRGTYSGTARDLLARDIRNLRNYTDAPNSSLQQLIQLNNQLYPGTFSK
jgi:hypothetical protein